MKLIELNLKLNSFLSLVGGKESSDLSSPFYWFFFNRAIDVFQYQQTIDEDKFIEPYDFEPLKKTKVKMFYDPRTLFE